MKSVLYYPLAFLAGLLIFIGLPLLGWGLGEIPQFFEHPARMAYVGAIIILQIFSVIYNPQIGRERENRQSGAPQPKIDLLLIQIFSLAIVLLAPFSDQHAFGTLNIGDGGRYGGLLLMAFGFVLMQIAEKYLDKQFSIQVTLQENHQLIQNGPYRWIRHPRYLGILAFFAGISVTFRSLLAISLAVALLLVLAWRIGVEEKLMQQTFGAAWETYRAKSWRMIPFVF